MDLKEITEIQIMDRADFLAALEEHLCLDPARLTILTVEMTKRRLNDRTPLPHDRMDSVLRNTAALLSMARGMGIPVVHCISSLRAIEKKFQESKPWNRIMRELGASVSPYGEVPDEFMDGQDGAFEPDLAVEVADSDFIIKTKKTFSCFYQTDLEWLLRTLRKDVLVLAGLSTNADILSTAYDASNKGLGVITMKECVASIYGDDLNTMALQQLARCQGFVLDLPTLSKKIGRFSPCSRAAR